jgi:hypothetical protein
MAWPSEATQNAVKFWLQVVQVTTVVAAVVGAAVTVIKYQEDAIRANEAVARELRRPYAERKLTLYLEAARVVAHLSATPDFEKEKTEARFWELYYGELAFVESKTANEARIAEDGRLGPSPAIEHLMVAFCEAKFGNGCHGDDKSGAEAARQALALAAQASAEIRSDWAPQGGGAK